MATNTSLANLKAIVIGAGFGGLSSAIELARRSASVRVFESVPDMSRQGMDQATLDCKSIRTD